MRDRSVLAVGASLALALAACGDARPLVGGGGGGTAGCALCHGAAGRTGNFPGTDPLLEAAPPRPPQNAPAYAVGAHQPHLNPTVAGALRGPLPCNSCHNPVPTDYSHVSNPPAEVVVFGGLALGPVSASAGTNPGTARWDIATGNPTCSAVYCHGSFQWFGNGQGGSDVMGNAFTPDWTKGPGQATCGSCHDLPPKGHVDLSPNLGTAPLSPAACSGCHPDTVRADGTISVSVSTGTSAHINGQIDEGAHADPNWCVLSSAFGQSAGCAPESASNPIGGAHTLAALDFTSPATGMQACLQCHSVGGVDFSSADGQPTSSCNDCHAAAGHPGWLTDCTFCHGTANRPANVPGTDPFLAAAPPRGVQGETDTTQAAVGAHQAHVNPTSAAQLANPFSCSQCHNPMPPAAPHPSGATSLVTFGGIATTGGAAPTYSPATGCSATYCHGNYSPGGNKFNPSWTGGASQGACGTCHDLPPATGGLIPTTSPPESIHVFHASVGLTCGNCHPGYGFATGPVNLSLHVNGVVDVGNNITSWDPTTGACVGCHGAANWFTP